LETAAAAAAAVLAAGMLAVLARRDKVLQAVAVPLLAVAAVVRPQSAQTL
jgi:hypothetical protein